MIGLDTNILLRWIVDDPTAPEQVALVRERLAAEPGPFYVNMIVLAETVWVLRRRAGQTRRRTAEILNTLLSASKVRTSNAKIAADALASFEAGGGGYADHLIGELNRHAGCKTTLTFDNAAQKSPAYTAIS